MTTETKVISSIVIATLLIIVGGIYIMSTQSANLPAVSVKSDILVRPDSAIKQSEQNHVTIVEFADYECPSCAVLHPTMKKLLSDPEYSKYVTLVYRNLPLHAGSAQVSTAVQAAGAQGKYWEMHDIVYEKQDEWAAVAASKSDRRAELFEQYATSIGLDIAAYRIAIKDPKYAELVKRDQIDAVTMGVNATPTLIINGVEVIQGAPSYERLKAAVDAELAKNN